MTNNKELFMKQIQSLFYVQCIAFAASLIVKLPFIGSWFSWIIKVVAIISVLVLFKLGPINERYRKAAIFLGIAVVLSIFSRIFAVLVVVGAICSIVGMYQEYHGHSEVMASVDEKLSRNWHSLFNWEFWGTFVVSFIAAICVVVFAVTATPEAAAGITEVIIDGYTIILEIVYLVFLKRMLTAYENYEPQVEKEASSEI